MVGLGLRHATANELTIGRGLADRIFRSFNTVAGPQATVLDGLCRTHQAEASCDALHMIRKGPSAMISRLGLPFVSVILCCSMTLVAAGQPPEIIHLATVAPDTLGITAQAGRIEYGRQVSYERQDGDQIRGDEKDRQVFRQGKFLGWLVGRQQKLVYTADTLEGQSLDTRWADDPGSYSLSSADDTDFTQPSAPVAVYRKTKPSDFGRQQAWGFFAPSRHVLYLKFAKPLKPGRSYRLDFQGDKLPSQSFRHDPRSQRSEAVHVSQIGFRGDDPVKTAFLSCWLGSGGPLKYSPALKFELLDDRTGETVFEGNTKLSKAAGEKDEDAYKKNYSGVDVYEMEFSQCCQPGVYRVYVAGVGCSYRFEIKEKAWQEAFFVSARGFYHQRSGIALGPPYTSFDRPRCFSPDGGLIVWHSTCPLMDSANGINALGTDKDNFGNLVKGKTDQKVSDAWGGYMDAGDWDRRIQHLIVTRYLVELADLFPDYFGNLTLNIPESGNQLPDIVDEGLFNLDCYRRMQMPEGGIRGGIESSEHPRHGEGSWQESLDVMAYAPGIWSSLHLCRRCRAGSVLLGIARPDACRHVPGKQLAGYGVGREELSGPAAVGRLVEDQRECEEPAA